MSVHSVETHWLISWQNSLDSVVKKKVMLFVSWGITTDFFEKDTAVKKTNSLALLIPSIKVI